jgi:hypothetical protein
VVATGVSTPTLTASTKPAVTTAVATADRPTVERLRSAFASSEIQLKFHAKDARQNVNSGSYVFDASTGRFVQSTTRAVHPLAPVNTAYQLLDTDGALFAYVDTKGGLWIIDDLIEEPGRLADDEPDEWSFVTDYNAAY